MPIVPKTSLLKQRARENFPRIHLPIKDRIHSHERNWHPCAVMKEKAKELINMGRNVHVEQQT